MKPRAQWNAELSICSNYCLDLAAAETAVDGGEQEQRERSQHDHAQPGAVRLAHVDLRVAALLEQERDVDDRAVHGQHQSREPVDARHVGDLDQRVDVRAARRTGGAHDERDVDTALGELPLEAAPERGVLGVLHGAVVAEQDQRRVRPVNVLEQPPEVVVERLHDREHVAGLRRVVGARAPTRGPPVRRARERAAP